MCDIISEELQLQLFVNVRILYIYTYMHVIGALYLF